MNITQQRNSNCVVQASQLNGGNLSQFFDLQAMRIVKGQAVLPTVINGQVNGVAGINKYDGSVIQLGTNETVISCIIENANPEVPIVCNNSDQQFALANVVEPPVYNPSTGIWEWTFIGDIRDIQICDAIDINMINAGIHSPIFTNYSGGSASYLVLGYQSFNGFSITTPNPAVNITLLVMSTV